MSLTTGELNISKTLSINGGNDGVSIVGNDTSRLLNLQPIGLSSPTITLNNLTLSGGGGVFDGGAITVNYDLTLNINNSTITENQAEYGGGIAVGAESTLNLSNTTVSTNTADYGGGIHSFGITNLNNSTVSGNNVSGFAAGIAIYTGTANINNSTISNNAALESGGGIFSINSTVNISNSTVSNNTALNDASGIYVKNLSVVTVDNSTVSNNGTETSIGGGFFIAAGSTLDLNNSTVSNNVGSTGGGIFVFDLSTVNLNNSIVANSTGGDCHLETGTITANNKNIIEDGSCSTDALNVDPLLGPLADNGGPTETHALLEGSPAINTGDNAICAPVPINNLDQRGVIRPIDAICDIGAFEFEASPEESGSSFFVIPLPNGKVVSFDL